MKRIKKGKIVKLKLFNKKLIKKDFYATNYFLKTRKILAANGIEHNSTIQFKCFSKKPFMVAGVNESIEIIKSYLGKKLMKLFTIHYFEDGSIIYPGQCVLSITGPYLYIACLENIIDGILARRSSVANNCFQFLHHLDSSRVIYMADRSDDYHLLPYDGYAAYVAGIRNFSNEAHAQFLKSKEQVFIVGTMPHSLIQQFNGDIEKTFDAYAKVYGDNVVVLVDYDNDIIKTLNKLKTRLDKIIAIRIDTSLNMIDKSLIKYKKNKAYYGSNAKLIKLVREWLDNNGGNHIKIISSSNNTIDKIKSFEKKGVPVDIYGIGSALSKLNLHFTADVVMNENKKQAKKGRRYISTEGMKLYKNEELSI